MKTIFMSFLLIATSASASVDLFHVVLSADREIVKSSLNVLTERETQTALTNLDGYVERMRQQDVPGVFVYPTTEVLHAVVDRIEPEFARLLGAVNKQAPRNFTFVIQNISRTMKAGRFSGYLEELLKVEANRNIKVEYSGADMAKINFRGSAQQAVEMALEIENAGQSDDSMKLLGLQRSESPAEIVYKASTKERTPDYRMVYGNALKSSVSVSHVPRVVMVRR